MVSNIVETSQPQEIGMKNSESKILNKFRDFDPPLLRFLLRKAWTLFHSPWILWIYEQFRMNGDQNDEFWNKQKVANVNLWNPDLLIGNWEVYMLVFTYRFVHKYFWKLNRRFSYWFRSYPSNSYCWMTFSNPMLSMITKSDFWWFASKSEVLFADRNPQFSLFFGENFFSKV
jgi:hypothetical protein